ncbi:hypothetical protein MKX01_034652 [Papaver californicum]|nr:hypothetical protein MKX01_034652 [Papaver californicum]
MYVSMLRTSKKLLRVSSRRNTKKCSKEFRRVEDIEKEIDKLNRILKKLQDENEESKSTSKAPTMKAIKQHMAKDVDKVSRIALLAKAKIEQLDRENLANRQKPGAGEGTAIERIRTASTLKLRDKMSEFQTLRQTIHREYRDVVERRVFTVTGQRVDEDIINHLIENGECEQIFQKAIQEQGRGQIPGTLAEIQEWHETVKELEGKLLDLQQVSNAVDHVNMGNNALQKAKKKQKSSRK